MSRIYIINRTNDWTNLIDFERNKILKPSKHVEISGLETNIFVLKIMIKSGLEFFILKF